MQEATAAAKPLLRGALTMVLAAASVCGGAGCAVVSVGVSNPMPEVRRIAIAPFINLSTEPDVDLGRETLFAGGYSDRRFAQAYFAELQKVPGFEVIPVGVVDQAIYNLKRPMEGPADYLLICEAIGADAICVGAVTDFDSYQPRLGLQVQWYALQSGPPPSPTQPFERSEAQELYGKPRGHRGFDKPALFGGRGASRPPVVCGQSPDGNFPAVPEPSKWDAFKNRPTQVAQATPAGPTAPAAGGVPPPGPQSAQLPPPPSFGDELPAPPLMIAGPAAAEPMPLYSYTRMFDGRDARLTARLRDYVELSGDLRAGGWEGYLTRSDDFIRFCSHVMIAEMLQLHGGESSREVVWKLRRQR